MRLSFLKKQDQLDINFNNDFAIEVNNLSKKIKGKVILDNLSFNIKKGIIFGLLGHNGAGKTTLIKLIVGVINKNSGKIKIMGNDTKRTNNCDISYLPEQFNFNSKIKVNEYLLGLTNFNKKTSTENIMAIKAMMKYFNLDDAVFKNICCLSSGMQKKWC